jgi:peptidyl-prolyl cis-trans isomerase C
MTMIHRRLIPLTVVLPILAASLLLAGCGGKDASHGDEGVVLARVGDREVTADYYTKRLARLQDNQIPFDDNGQRHDMATLAGKRAFLDIIIDKELMVSKALQLGYDKDTGVQMGLGHLNEYHAMIYFWQDEIGDPSRFVSDEDFDYYVSRLGERRVCDYIITDIKADADQALADMAAGAPWSEVVAKYHRGGMRDGNAPGLTVNWGQYRDEFERPIFTTAVGEVSEPIETEHGWWLVRVNNVEHQPKGDVEAMRGEIVLSIAKRNETLRREDMIKKAAAAHGLMIDEEALRIVFDGLPEGESLIDPETQQPRQAVTLKPLDVPTESYGRVLMSYNIDAGPYTLTIADYKAKFDKQNVFERAKRGEMLGGLRIKLRDAAHKSIMVDEARRLGYFEDPRVIKDSYRRIEEMLVEKVQQDLVQYEEYVSQEELETFWTLHATDYYKPERRSGFMVRCKNEELAQAARRAVVDQGMTWKQVNKRYGNDAELNQTFGRIIQMRADAGDEVRPVLYGLNPGQVSEPFAVSGGWAVVQLEKIHEPEQPVLADMTEAVGARIRNQRMDASLRALLGEWTDEFGVTVYEDELATMPSWDEAVQAAAQEQMIVPGR